jgi:hypothetical protein
MRLNKLQQKVKRLELEAKLRRLEDEKDWQENYECSFSFWRGLEIKRKNGARTD